MSNITYLIGSCSLGAILLAQSDIGICAIFLSNDRDELVRNVQVRFPGARLVDDGSQFNQQLLKVIALIETPGMPWDVPLDIRGTAFQQRVWQALREIPVGQTASYTEIACRINAPKSARAVAQACAANKLAIVIPCHRVVRSDGSLSGYRWGVERKRALLQNESKLISNF